MVGGPAEGAPGRRRPNGDTRGGRLAAILRAMPTRSAPDGPLLYAHRGTPRLFPENSMPGLAHAIALGADVLEIDAHMTADGHVVVVHDADGTRMAGVDRAIRESPLSLVQAWDVATGFDGEVAGPVRVATLDAVLRELPRARLNIDVKQTVPDMVLPLLELLHRHRAASRVLLTSFEHRTLRRIRRAGYGGQTGLSQREAIVAAFAPRRVAALRSPRAERLQIPTHYMGVDLGTRRFIDRFHRQALRVDYWVVNDTDHARRLLDLGADGIVTDVPDVMGRVFATHARTGGWRARHPERAAELSG